MTKQYGPILQPNDSGFGIFSQHIFIGLISLQHASYLREKLFYLIKIAARTQTHTGPIALHELLK